MKTFIIITTLVLALIVSACAPHMENASQQTAEQFIRNDPTFAFDGSDLRLEREESCEPNCKTYVYTFTSASAGYGDRSDSMSAQVITPHTVHVTVRDNAVVDAVMDDKLDMLSQQMFCTEEAMICPDGKTVVARNPALQCAFDPCPPAEQVVCAADVQECADGSFVSRNPDNACAFDTCPGEEVFCTLDAMQCPDGTFVGRNPADNCAFYSCPGN